MLVIWTNKEGRQAGKIISGGKFKKDDESFYGGVVFGDEATSLVYGLSADRLFEVEPIGEKTQILLQAEPIAVREVRIFGFKMGEVVEEEKKIYGRLWKSQKVRIVRELNAVSTLRSLSVHPDFWVRRAVAGNVHTPPDVLVKLSFDESGWVLAAVAANKNTPDQTRINLCHCADDFARSIAIRRAKLGLAALREMEQEKTPLIELVVKNKIKNHKDAPILTRVKLALLGW